MGRLPSLCGINCYLCEQYLGDRCKICLNEESKRGCEVLNCVEVAKVENCLECVRITYCEKRRRSIDACLVFRPKEELAWGTIYLLTGSWEEGMITFAKNAFVIGRSVVITEKEPELLAREFMLDNARIYQLVAGGGGEEKLDPSDLAEIKRVIDGIDKNEVILLDGLRCLIEANTFTKILELIGWMNQRIHQHSAVLLIMAQDLTEDEKQKIKKTISDFKVKEILKSISNPRRMEILHYLRQTGKSTFTEIYRALGYTLPPQLSFHLRILKDCGILEQDDEGIYYISNVGRAVADVIGEIGRRVERGEVSQREKPKVIPAESWQERYELYLRRMRRVDSTSADVLTDVKNSLQLIFGKRKTDEIFQEILKDYIETEKKMTRGDLKRMISEIVFVFLVDSVPLVEAIEWADELLKKHNLKQK